MLYIMIGISASGKSTKAKEIKDNADKPTVIVSRDKLREMCFGYTEENVVQYYDLHKKNNKKFNEMEKTITELQHSFIQSSLGNGYDVIIDDTNLKISYINKFLKRFPNESIKYIIVNTPLKECIERDSKRTRKVGEAVIKDQYNKFTTLMNSEHDFSDKVFEPLKITSNPLLDDCFIFDIDGTLAEISHRDPYDYDKLMDDSPIIPSMKLCQALYESGNKIVFCSGRPDSYKEMTAEWLKLHLDFLKYDEPEIYMRSRYEMFKPDFEIKEVLWQNIATKYNIVALIDDRLQVVRHAVDKGLFVFNVNQRLKEF